MSILYLTADTFKSTVQNTDKPLLVDFYADWCMPCQMLSPILEKVAEKCGDKAVIAKINIDQAENIAAEYKVASIPTMIVFKDGAEVRRQVGAIPAGEILSLLEI